MKKQLILIIGIILLFAGQGWGATETFYVCNGGDGTLPETATCATAYDCDDLDTAGNWDTDDSDDGKIGPNDEVHIMDEGGVLRCDVTVRQSGTSGKPITIKNYTGDTPIISGAS